MNTGQNKVTKLPVYVLYSSLLHFRLLNYANKSFAQIDSDSKNLGLMTRGEMM
jgi:hypothetical protein